MESITITNVQDLQSEIQQLRLIEAKQKIALGKHFSSPAAIFTSIKSLFPKKPGGLTSAGVLHPDMLKIISRFAIPFTLNKTIFRNSNFLVKALISLISQKAANLVTEASAENFLTKGKNLFTRLFHKAQPVKKLKPSINSR